MVFKVNFETSHEHMNIPITMFSHEKLAWAKIITICGEKSFKSHWNAWMDSVVNTNISTRILILTMLTTFPYTRNTSLIIIIFPALFPLWFAQTSVCIFVADVNFVGYFYIFVYVYVSISRKQKIRALSWRGIWRYVVGDWSGEPSQHNNHAVCVQWLYSAPTSFYFSLPLPLFPFFQ